MHNCILSSWKGIGQAVIRKILDHINLCGKYALLAEVGETEEIREHAKIKYQQEYIKIRQIKMIFGE